MQSNISYGFNITTITMKKFFEGIKRDIQFKSAGQGKKLTDDTRYKVLLSSISGV